MTKATKILKRKVNEKIDQSRGHALGPVQEKAFRQIQKNEQVLRLEINLRHERNRVIKKIMNTHNNFLSTFKKS